MSKSSKSKVIVLTALQEGISMSAVDKRFGISRRWVHILLARYRKDGLDALAAKSITPKTAPLPSVLKSGSRSSDFEPTWTGLVWIMEQQRLLGI